MKLVTLLVCISIVAAGEIYYIPTVIIDTPMNDTCPPELEAVRNELLQNISDILADRFNNFSIPECGGSGWRRVAYLNMTDPDQSCPDAWRPYEQDPTTRACGRQLSDNASCNSVMYSTDEYEYTQVCGRITGYQYASPDAGNHYSYIPTQGDEINEPYLDGVSITYGDPRMHIWSFYGGLYATTCCNTQHANNSESLGFIGNNSFCDTGNPTNLPWTNIHFTEHPLWDGINNCVSSTTCCAPQPGPWLYTTIPLPSLYDIEVRICGDQSTYDEDTPVKLIELYVK